MNASRLPIALLAALASLLAGCAGAPERKDRGLDVLMAERRAENTLRTNDLNALTDRFLARVAAETKRDGQSTIDILVVSGGGDWGAFGAGVLKGWGRVKGANARPRFDIVTGVSTGALIAPFAFLGDDASIERIVQLYRNPRKDIAASRGQIGRASCRERV